MIGMISILEIKLCKENKWKVGHEAIYYSSHAPVRAGVCPSSVFCLCHMGRVKLASGRMFLWRFPENNVEGQQQSRNV